MKNMTTCTQTTLPPRDNYMQAVRGLCIIAVVMIHIPPVSGVNISQQVINFAVAVFFFISGYFVKTETFSLKKRTLRTWLPYCLWTIFALLVYGISLRFLGGRKIDFDTYEIIKIIFFGGAAPQLYFLSVLLQLTLLTPFLIKLIQQDNRVVDFVCWAVTPVYVAIMYLYDYITGSRFPLYCALFPAWFGFYYAGMVVRERNITLRVSNVTLVALLLLTLYLSLAESQLLETKLPWIAVSQIKFSSMFYAVAVIALVLKNHDPQQPAGLLSRIGDYSFGIYLIHIYVLVLIKKSVDVVFGNTLFYPFLHSQFVRILLVVAISYAIVSLLAKVVGDKSAKYVGLK